MSFYDEVASDLQEIESDLSGNSLSTGGVDAPCIPSSIRAGQVMETGGRVVTIVQTLRARSSYFATAPTAWAPITWTRDETAVEYRIASVRFPAPFAHYEIDIVDLSES
jgi:hypothetical protein